MSQIQPAFLYAVQSIVLIDCITGRCDRDRARAIIDASLLVQPNCLFDRVEAGCNLGSLMVGDKARDFVEQFPTRPAWVRTVEVPT